MNASKKSTAGLGYFNLARGCGMLFVLLGHSITVFYPKSLPIEGNNLGMGTIVGSGIMAMFLFISGYGFYQRKMKKTIAIQKKLLLRPYIITAIAVLLTKLALAFIERRPFMKHGGEYILTYALGLNAEGGGRLMGIPIESIGIFWFVLSLMNGWIIYNAILKIKNVFCQRVLTIGCLLAGYSLTIISPVWPYCLHMSLMAVGYLAGGMYIREHQLLDIPVKKRYYALLMIPVLISAIWGRVDMLSGMWKLGIIDIISTFCLGYMLMRGFVWLSGHLHRGRIIQWIEAIGFNSIWIICLHAYEKVIFPWYRLAIYWSDQPVMGVILCMACRGLVIYILYQLAKTWIHISKKNKKKNKPRITID